MVKISLPHKFKILPAATEQLITTPKHTAVPLDPNGAPVLRLAHPKQEYMYGLV